MGFIGNIVLVIVIIGALFYFYPNEMGVIKNNSLNITTDITQKVTVAYDNMKTKQQKLEDLNTLLTQMNVSYEELCNMSKGHNVSYKNITICN